MHSLILKTAAVVISIGVVSFSAASAAKLKVISQKQVRYADDGSGLRLVPEPSRGGSGPQPTPPNGAGELHSISPRAVGTGAILQLNYSNQINPSSAVSPLTGTQLNFATADVLIEPDTGERAGDPVCVAFHYEATAHAEATGAADFRAGVGGGHDPSDITYNFDPTELSFTYPATIILDPSGANVTELSAGPTVLMPGQPDLNEAQDGRFLAQIGNHFVLNASTASVWYVPPGDSAFGTDTSLLYAKTLGVSACSVAIPALSVWGLAALALLLAAGGLFLSRRIGG